LDQLGVSRDIAKSVPSDRGKERGGIAGNFLKYASKYYEWYDKIEKVLIAENMKKLQNAQMSSD
jgi:intein/homing endonuclease